MKLSKLVFLSVKNVLYLNDTSFNYESFKQGYFDNDVDYALNIHNVFSPLNEAISRLSDLERLPYVIEEVNITDGIIDLSTLNKQCKEVINVAKVINGVPIKLEHRQYIGTKILVIDYNKSYLRNEKYLIEYKEDIEMFDEDSYSYEYDEEGNEIVDRTIEVELRDYGITDSMCNYIIEYVQGRLQEPIAPELANMHITRAETYFNNIAIVKPALSQIVVNKTYTVI